MATEKELVEAIKLLTEKLAEVRKNAIVDVNLTEDNIEFINGKGVKTSMPLIKTSGKDGENGVGITQIYEDNNSLLVELSNGKTVNLGNFHGTNGINGNGIKDVVYANGQFSIYFDNGQVREVAEPFIKNSISKLNEQVKQTHKLIETHKEEVSNIIKEQFARVEQLNEEAEKRVQALVSNIQGNKDAQMLKEQFDFTTKQLGDEIETKSSGFLATAAEIENRFDNEMKKLTMRINTVATANKAPFSNDVGGGFDGGNLSKYIGFKTVVCIPINNVLEIQAKSGNTFVTTLDQDVTQIFRVWPSPTVAQRIVLYVKQNSTGGNQITSWDPNILWQNGVVPSISTTPNAYTVFVFETFDSGQTIIGNLVGKNYI